jgi:hypothetical protein
MTENWSDDELAAAVEAYREMYRLEAAGKSYPKRDFYRALAKRFGRTEKAFELPNAEYFCRASRTGQKLDSRAQASRKRWSPCKASYCRLHTALEE